MVSSKQSVVVKLRKQAKNGKLADNVAIVYRINGGSGEDRIEKLVALTLPGGLKVKVAEVNTKIRGEAYGEIDTNDTLNLCKLMLDGVDSMIPEAKASFVPDTLIGSVTFAIGNEKETFYFVADEEDCEHRGQPIQSEIKNIMNHINQIEIQHLSSNGQGRGRLS